MKLRHYKFMSDDATVVITDISEKRANKTLNKTVVFPDSFRLEGWEEV